MAYKRLGDILVSVGVITQDQLEEALQQGSREKKRLGEVLIQNKTITERQLIDVLKLQLGVEFIDLTKANIPGSLTQYVPKNLARKHSIVPVKVIGDALHLAMVDPLNFVAIEEVKFASKKRVIPMIATKQGVDRAVMTLYGNEGVTRAIDDMQRVLSEDSAAMADMEIQAEFNQSGVDEGENAAPSIRLVNSIIERAVAENASDIHLEPREDGLAVRMRIDGVLHNILTVPSNLKNSVISRVKIMGDMDIAERRIPQDGRSNVRIRQMDIDMRMATLPTIYGEKVVIRLLRKTEQLLTSQGIGLTGNNLAKYEELIKNSSGVILLVGPTGSGKSSTMYTMINDLNSEEVNIVTLEDPVEYNLEGINQVQINEKTGLTFASGLRSILRQDPDIIAVGEIRDGETAEIAMRSAITGHLVLSTVHANDSTSTLSRLVDIGVEPYIITNAVKGIIYQRLVRKICPHCKKPYKPDEEELDILHMTPEEAEGVEFYKGEGCPECLDTGYRGRTGVFEILMLNTQIKRKFRDNASSEELQKAIDESGFEPLVQDCRKLVLSGETTVDEARKILHTTD